MRALAHAIPVMRQTGFWDRLVAVHAGNWHQHHGWLFLPWHRAFLRNFELAVRQLTYDDFRMPYLDWDADTIPETLYEPPFLRDGRVRGPRDSMRAFQSAQLSFREGAPAGFDDFFGAPDYGGDDESFGHNLVHVFIGGDMGNISTAPRDPLFYFHHANVDRLWWYWAQTYGCSQSDCYPPDWLDEQLHGIVDTRGNPVAPFAVRSLVSTQALGYEYPSVPVMVGAAPPMAEMARRPETEQPGYSGTVQLLSRPAQSVAGALPPEFLKAVLTARRAQIKAPLFVRTMARGPHEIRISLPGSNGKERIFAMPMGSMGASYVKNISSLLEPLAKGLTGDAANAEIGHAPALRIEASAGAVLTECTVKITARLWV